MIKTPQLSGFLRPGCLVEFLLDNEPHLAWVLEESSGKLRLLTRAKREIKLASTRILPWPGPECQPQATREEIQRTLDDHEANRRAILAGINIMELWTLAQGELDHAPAMWFADLLWQQPGVDELAAMGRALLAAKTHFKFNPPDFDIHPADKVEARLTQQREEKEREAVVSAGHELFQALWARIKAGQAGPSAQAAQTMPEAARLDPEVAERLAAMLKAQVAGSTHGPENERLARLWESLKKHLPDQPHLALLLAQAWGILPAHHNHLLDEAGYAWGDSWSQAFSDEIDALAQAFEDEAGQVLAAGALDPLPFVSIDAATTRDIDDAFHVSPATLPDGRPGFAASIALARPTAHWNFGSPLDREVFSRVTSLYLPEGSGHMMPEALGTGLYSLTAGAVRPALVADFLLDEQGATVSLTPRLTWVRLAANLSYDATEEVLAQDESQDSVLDGPMREHASHVRVAHRLAQALFARRLEHGAVVITKPEPMLELSGEGADTVVNLELKPASVQAELLVSEFMILANQGLACWARDNGVPVLNRTQDIALPKEATGVFCETVDIFRVVKLLAPPTLETKPRRHAALACEAYATMTSPLRRYIDFLNMAQVESWLATGAPRLDRAALDALLPHLSARLQAVTPVQRFRPRYWKLVYLAQHKREPFAAVVVDEVGPYPTLSLPDLQITVRVPRAMLGDKVHPGQQVQVLFGRIDALTNELKVLEVQEA